MDNCFTSFRPLTHIVANNIRTTSVLSKSMLRKYTIIVEKLLWMLNLWTAYMKIKSSLPLVRTTAVRLTYLFLQLVNQRDLFAVGTKLKKNIFKNKNQINSTVTTKTWVLGTEGTRTWPSTGLMSGRKMVWLNLHDICFKIFQWY